MLAAMQDAQAQHIFLSKRTKKKTEEQVSNQTRFIF